MRRSRHLSRRHRSRRRVPKIHHKVLPPPARRCRAGAAVRRGGRGLAAGRLAEPVRPRGRRAPGDPAVAARRAADAAAVRQRAALAVHRGAPDAQQRVLRRPRRGVLPPDARHRGVAGAPRPPQPVAGRGRFHRRRRAWRIVVLHLDDSGAAWRRRDAKCRRRIAGRNARNRCGGAARRAQQGAQGGGNRPWRLRHGVPCGALVRRRDAGPERDLAEAQVGRGHRRRRRARHGGEHSLVEGCGTDAAAQVAADDDGVDGGRGGQRRGRDPHDPTPQAREHHQLLRLQRRRARGHRVDPHGARPAERPRRHPRVRRLPAKPARGGVRAAGAAGPRIPARPPHRAPGREGRELARHELG
mmetsp:Transcript_3642/g.11441  ORF Transcript_3642/g.11441 Transcript_3642/m.11441 type:complete len:357 (+) Transcript_3642:797-1867(+)